MISSSADEVIYLPGFGQAGQRAAVLEISGNQALAAASAIEANHDSYCRHFGDNLLEAMIKPTEWNARDKLLFASDYPLTMAAEPVEASRHVNDFIAETERPRLPEDKLEAISYRDSLKLLELD